MVRTSIQASLFQNAFCVTMFLLAVCGVPALFLIITVHGMPIFHAYITLMNSTISFAHHCIEGSF